MHNKLNYWLFKSESSSYSWQQMEIDQITCWNGVRNFQARNNMKSMRINDLGFFYHSNKEKAIVGIVEVCKEYYPDDTDVTNNFGMVDVKYIRTLSKPVELKEIKSNENLQDIILIKQSRLSVMPITELEWNTIILLSGTDF